MPSLHTHYLCGNKALKLMKNDALKNHLESYRSIFNLGTQGPDIFFYYGAWPWAKSNGIPAIGNMLHEEKTGEFILEALKYTGSSVEEVKKTLIAYLCGYLCHYELDCHTHPYIFYKSGFIRKGEPDTSKYDCYHRMFETALDVLMLEHELGKKPKEFDASQHIIIPGRDAAVISEMYSNVIKKVYNESISVEVVLRAISDMTSISAVLHDKTGAKKFLLSGVEKVLGIKPMFSSMILPLRLNDHRDYLNLHHATWNLPWDKGTGLTASFPEMFEAAASEASVLCNSILDYLYGEVSLDNVTDLIGSRSFSTGIDCKLDTEFAYFDCIYE